GVENVFTIIDSSNVSDPRNKKKSIVKTNPQAIWDEYGESSFFQSQYYWNVGYWINSLFRLNSLSDYRNFDVNLYFLNTKLNFDREVDTDKMVDFVSFRDQRHLYFLSYSFFINTHNLPTQPLPRILTYDNNGAFLEKIVPSFDDIKLDPPRVKKVYKFFSDTIIQSFRDYEAEEKERQEKEEKEKAEKDNGNGQDSNKVNSVSTEPNNKNSSDADSKDNNDSSDSQGKDSSKSKPKFRPRLPQFFDRVSINYSKFSSSFNTQLKHIHQGLSTRDEAMEIFKDKVALFYALSMAYDNFTFQKDSGIIDNTSLNKFKTEFNKKQKELTEKNKQKQDGKDQKSQRMTQGADKAVTVEPKAMQSEIGMTDQTNDQSSSETKDSMDSSDSSDTVDNTDESEDKQSEEEEKFDEEIENAKKM
ncbi:ABC transporter permease, partial [Mycoplasmoides pneumoniae]